MLRPTAPPAARLTAGHSERAIDGMAFQCRLESANSVLGRMACNHSALVRDTPLADQADVAFWARSTPAEKWLGSQVRMAVEGEGGCDGMNIFLLAACAFL